MNSPESPRALIIGSGLGGLAAAIRLQARGYATTILEARDRPGGRAAVYEESGYRFDAGPTIITAPFLIDELFALGGGKTSDYLTLKPCDPYYRVLYDDGTVINYRGGREELLKEVRRISPSDEKGFQKFAAFSHAVFQRGFVDLADKPFLRLTDMLKAAPDMIRLEAYRSVYDKAAGYMKDPRLRFLFSFHPLFVGGSPFKSPSLYAMVHHLELEWGVHSVQGGTGRLVAGLLEHFQKLGGNIRFNVPVTEIEVENGQARGVRLENGESLPAKVVVSNADVAHTYGRLIAPQHRRRWTDRKLERAEYSMGVFMIYFGVRRRYPELAQHTIILSHRYKDLIDDIFVRQTLAPDFSLYLYAPSQVDPSMAPEGCSSFYVLSPVPNLQGGIDWEKEKERYASTILASLEKIMPGLQSQIEVRKIVTPRDFERDLRAPHGNAFSLCPTLFQSAWFRPHNISEDIRNLYIVGAGTHPGAGVPGVLCSAKILDRVVPDPV